MSNRQVKEKLKIVTFNIRCPYNSDGINSFMHRAVEIADKIANESPDIIAFQEITDKIVEVLRKLMPGYMFVGHGRNADYKGEGLYTAVKMDTCSILGWECFWLSPTPYIPASRFEVQSEYPRICLQTMVRHNLTGRIMRVYNVHLDLMIPTTREEELKVAFNFIERYKKGDGFPYVLLGDFNAKPDEKTIEICRNYPGLREVNENISVTFHGFKEKNYKIDYIFMSDELADCVKTCVSWQDEHSGIFLSDHYPVCAELEI